MIKALISIFLLVGFSLPSQACTYMTIPNYSFRMWYDSQIGDFARNRTPGSSLRFVFGHFESIGPIQIENTSEAERQRLISLYPNHTSLENFSARRVSALSVFLIVDPNPYSERVERIEVELLSNWNNLPQPCGIQAPKNDGYKDINFSYYLRDAKNYVYAFETRENQPPIYSGYRVFEPRYLPNNLQSRWLSRCVFEGICDPNRAFWIRGWLSR